MHSMAQPIVLGMALATHFLATPSPAQEAAIPVVRFHVEAAAELLQTAYPDRYGLGGTAAPSPPAPGTQRLAQMSIAPNQREVAMLPAGVGRAAGGTPETVVDVRIEGNRTGVRGQFFLVERRPFCVHSP